MKKFIINLFVLGLLAGGGYAGYYYMYLLPKLEQARQDEIARKMKEEEQAKIQAEADLPLEVRIRRGMAEPGMVALGYFDHKRAVDTSSGVALTDLNKLPFESLKDIKTSLQAVSSFQDKIKQSYIAFYPQQYESSVTSIITFMGNFDVPEISRQLVEGSQAEEENVDGFPLKVFYAIDNATCEKTDPTALYVDKNYIVAGVPDLVTRTVKRIKKKKVRDYLDPANWHKFNQDKVFTIWIRHPSATIKNFFPEPFNSFSRDSFITFRTFNNAFASFNVDKSKGEGSLSLELHGRNVNDVLAMKKSWESVLREHNESLTGTVRSLSNAISKASVLADHKVLRLDLAMNRLWFDNILDIAEGVTHYVVDQMSIGSIKRTAREQRQGDGMMLVGRLDPNPQIFKRSAQLIDLKEYGTGQLRADGEPILGRADSITGPFGIIINEVRDTGSNVAFDISAVSGHIPNLGQGIGKAYLRLTSITNSKGESLQNQLDCGPKRFNPRLELKRHEKVDAYHAKMTVHLKEGVTAGRVSSIKGMVNVMFPTRTSTHPIFLPSELPYTVNIKDIKLTVLWQKNGLLEYSVEGNVDRLLSFHGLDHKRQRIAKKYSKREETKNTIFPRPAKIIDRYEGKIHALELVYAEAVEELEFPFRLNGLKVIPNQEAIVVDEPRIARVKSVDFQKEVEAFDKVNSAPLIGPFFMELTRLQNWDSLTGEIHVIAPVSVPGLSENLNTSLSFDTVELLDGTKVDLLDSEPIEDLVEIADKQRLLSSRLLFNPVPENGGLIEAAVKMQTDIKVDPSRVRSLHGQVKVNLPQSANKITIPAERVGEEIGTDEFKAKLMKISREGYELKILTGQERLLRVVPRDLTGKPLVPFFIAANIDGESLSLKFETGDASYLDLYVAGEIESLEYPILLLN